MNYTNLGGLIDFEYSDPAHSSNSKYIPIRAKQPIKADM